MTETVFCQSSRLVYWQQVDSILKENTDSLTVMNFWATWCKPCVAELPHFEHIRKDYSRKPVRFLYISLDFAEEKEKRLDPFIARKLPGARVWLLNETSYNDWIGRISPDWSGAIPATLFFQHSTKKRIFADSELSTEKLQSILEQFTLISK